MVGEGLVMSRGFRVCRARGGPGLASPATAGAGRGRGRVQWHRGVTVRLKVLAGGPGAARVRGTARVLSVSNGDTNGILAVLGVCWARDLRALSSSSSTTASVGGARVVRWRVLARWPGQERKGRGGGAARW